MVYFVLEHETRVELVNVNLGDAVVRQAVPDCRMGEYETAFPLASRGSPIDLRVYICKAGYVAVVDPAKPGSTDTTAPSWYPGCRRTGGHMLNDHASIRRNEAHTGRRIAFSEFQQFQALLKRLMVGVAREVDLFRRTLGDPEFVDGCGIPVALFEDGSVGVRILPRFGHREGVNG